VTVVVVYGGGGEWCYVWLVMRMRHTQSINLPPVLIDTSVAWRQQCQSPNETDEGKDVERDEEDAAAIAARHRNEQEETDASAWKLLLRVICFKR
jgi:hypothetical protein